MPEGTTGQPNVVAAGAVVLGPAGRVLLVHRPRYDDWSFPKGKLDPGEGRAAAAVREVAEETGLQVRLGPPLAAQHYRVADPEGDRDKTVHYWVGWVVGDHDVSGYRANEEVDAVAWVPYDEALGRLSYAHDRSTLLEAAPLREPCCAVVVLRHAKARSRKEWTGRPDRERPLAPRGEGQAVRLVPTLAAYGVGRVVTSSSTRCVQTVRSWADSAGLRLEELDGLSEEDATRAAVAAVVEGLLTDGRSVVVCSHRKVLPLLLAALGVPGKRLRPGGMVVVHHRKGQVVATELVDAP